MFSSILENYIIPTSLVNITIFIKFRKSYWYSPMAILRSSTISSAVEVDAGNLHFFKLLGTLGMQTSAHKKIFLFNKIPM